MSELKPCPNLWLSHGSPHVNGSGTWIGPPKICKREVMSGAFRYRVECGCRQNGAFGDTEEEAVSLWNTRPTHDALVEALKPFAKFAKKFEANPLSGVDDEMYSIHGGDFEPKGASFRLSDCQKARAALKAAGVDA